MDFISEVSKVVTTALQELSVNEAALANLKRKYTPPKSPYFVENVDRTAEFIAYKKHETALLERTTEDAGERRKGHCDSDSGIQKKRSSAVTGRSRPLCG